MLTAFVKRLTDFNIVDATELEEAEPPISADLSKMIESYRPVTSLDRLFKGTDSKCSMSFLMHGLTAYLIDVELIQVLVDVLMRWTLGSQVTDIPIDGHFHEAIALGVGFIDKEPSTQEFDPNNNSVYLSERSVVLSLRSLFEKYSWTTRHSWINHSVRIAPNNSSLGYVFEDITLLVLMDHFGGKFSPLSDAFHCSKSLGSRRVTLVSLRCGADGLLQSYPVSWNKGISDRFGFKAKSPTEVLAFLNNPDGQTFVFPDIHMGPDLIFFLQDEQTLEVIGSIGQAKVTPVLDVGTWISAVQSVTPRFFYTMVVSIKSCDLCCAQSLFQYIEERRTGPICTQTLSRTHRESVRDSRDAPWISRIQTSC